MTRPPRALTGALVVLAALSALAFVPAAQAAGRVHLRGTAYEFNNVKQLLPGATIRVAELPAARATVRADGTYDLVVPDRTTVTPYIEAAGHHTIYLQTFRTDGEDLANVNFQTPSDAIYQALKGLLGVQVDAQDNPRACVIVSTFSTRNVRDLSYAGFIGYGAHGIAGATATTTPALPSPTYFNESVIPDPAQKSSSKDGGVLWTNVPDGVYTVAARHPDTRFATFKATCRAGRVVNANPPWGLHELAPKSPATVTARWSRSGARATLRELRVAKLPKSAVVTVSCDGRGCPLTSRTIRPRGASADLRRSLPTAARSLRAGQTLDVRVTAHRFNGIVARFSVGSRGTPKRTTLCLPLENSEPRTRC